MDGEEPPPEDVDAGPITMDTERSELEASGTLALALDRAAATGGLGKAAGGLAKQPRHSHGKQRQGHGQLQALEAMASSDPWRPWPVATPGGHGQQPRHKPRPAAGRGPGNSDLFF